MQYFTFGKEVNRFKTLNFTEKNTQITLVADYLKNGYSLNHLPVVLVTDGNQTQGKDYIHSFPLNTTVYPIVVGDTIPWSDLKITQVNANEYTLQNNRFPVEVLVNYSGNQKSVTTELIIEKHFPPKFQPTENLSENSQSSFESLAFSFSILESSSSKVGGFSS